MFIFFFLFFGFHFFYFLLFTRHPSPVTRHPSPVTRHPPPVTRSSPPVTRYPPPVTRHPPPAEKSCRLEVEAESEGRLQRVKSQLQHVRSVLHTNSRTPMGNLLMTEKLLQAFLESEQRGMASQNPLFCRVRSHAISPTTQQKLATLGFKQISFLLMCWLVRKILLAVLTFTHLVNRWKTTLLLLMTPYSILWPLWLVTTGIVHYVALL